MSKSIMMRILLISLWYKPEPVAKPHDFAAELVRCGHEVTVITGVPNYPSGHIYNGYRVRWRHWETIDGVRVLRVPHMVDRSHSAFRRVLSYLSFSLTSAALGAISTKRPDIIWTYQIGLPGVILAALWRTVLIHEVQDLWPEWGQTATVGLRSWLFRILNWQEKVIYRRARVITTISKGFRQALLGKGAPATKIELIPNWANEQNFRPVPRDLHLAEVEGLAGCFNVMYAGNVGTAQALDVIIEAAKLLANLPDVQFVVVGDGVERERLTQRAVDEGLSNVRFLGGRAPDQMANYLALADVLLIHLMRLPAYEVTIPSKTYSYLAVGRPILAAAAGDVADLVQEIGAGMTCPPEDPAALAQAVHELYAMPNEQREAMGQAGREAYLKHYTRAVLVDRYEKVFEEVAAKKRMRDES